MSRKKSFDRETMYQKIMPSYLGDDAEETKVTPETEKSESSSETLSSEEAFFRNKEIQELSSSDEKVGIYNITEKVVFSKIDKVLSGMGGCRCQRCKMDILALTLNQLEPHYVVCTENEINAKVITSNLNQQVTATIIKAAVMVRKNPRHEV